LNLIELLDENIQLLMEEYHKLDYIIMLYLLLFELNIVIFVYNIVQIYYKNHLMVWIDMIIIVVLHIACEYNPTQSYQKKRNDGDR
jgi:hypothetical protein